MRQYLLLPLILGIAASAAERAAERISSLNETVPQVIFGGEWTTRITFINTRSSVARFPLSLFGADGRALTVPLVGVDGPPSANYQVTVPAGGQLLVETAYDPGAPTITGTAYADFPCTTTPEDACGRIAGLVMLRNRNATRPDFEAVFSLKSGTRRGLVAFDHAGGGGTVLMVASDNRFATLTITAAIRDQNGNRVALDQFTLPSRGTMLVNLAEKWPASAGIRGSIELTSDSLGLIVTGLRINPSNSFAPLNAFDW